METKSFAVPSIHCEHCKVAVTRELEGISGVETVEVDLETKLVTVGGDRLDGAALVAAIDEAGYDGEPIPV